MNVDRMCGPSVHWWILDNADGETLDRNGRHKKPVGNSSNNKSIQSIYRWSFMTIITNHTLHSSDVHHKQTINKPFLLCYLRPQAPFPFVFEY